MPRLRAALKIGADNGCEGEPLKNTDCCLICGARELQTRKGAVAPFLAQRIWDREAFAVALASCQACGFMFFTPRLEQEEEQRLYTGYRGAEYQRLRQACEPWYTKAFNDNLSSPGTWQLRQGHVGKILRDNLDAAALRSILDFGGAQGHLAKDLVPQAEVYVYDISAVEPVAGVGKLSSLADCQGRHFDLILVSNVLEHVAYPRELCRQVAQIASPGTLIFIEVPRESPDSLQNMAKRLAQLLVLAVRRPPIARALLRLGTLKLMHEHVNFFSPSALCSLVKGMAWDVVAQGKYKMGGSVTAAEMLWVLARIQGAGT
jgi:2-polyprenyl-3-methyl-5-hydroxy-6-metoxy-1,4-benzoquinol methylase